MKRGADGIWRTVGGIAVTPKQQAEYDKVRGEELPIHTFFIVNSKYPPSAIQEVECKVVVTENR